MSYIEDDAGIMAVWVSRESLEVESARRKSLLLAVLFRQSLDYC